MDAIETRIKKEVLSTVVERSNYPLLVINPDGDLYQFLDPFEVKKNWNEDFSFLRERNKQIKIIKSIRHFDEQEKYALVLSGVYGFEVGTQDVGPKDYSTHQTIELFQRLAESKTPVATLTVCCAIKPLSQLDCLQNVLFFGSRPTDFRAFSYMINCYAKGKILPIPKITCSSEENVVGLFDSREKKRINQQNELNLEEVMKHFDKKRDNRKE